MNFVRMAAKSEKASASPAPAETSEGSTAASPRKGQAAFDLWLQRGLHKLFDDVASEPIPEDLLRLIEDDRKGS
jgi:hypothetical protein